jgi:LmbE family N-acetylglucosaminyl deacetylase
MKIAAVSPHLDDAALSASAALADAAAATVLTVFTAMPPGSLELSSWDQLTGAAASAPRQRDRLAEDHAAMALLSASAIHLGAPEILYRDGPPDLAAAIGQLTAALADADQVWLPSAIGGHPDHRLARDAALQAAAAAGHREVMLYADFPYVIAYGWPGCVTGQACGPFLDTNYWLSSELVSAGLVPASLTPVVTRLDDGQRRTKAAVITAYASQAAALRLSDDDLARDPGKLDYELAWRMPLDAGRPGRA